MEPFVATCQPHPSYFELSEKTHVHSASCQSPSSPSLLTFMFLRGLVFIPLLFVCIFVSDFLDIVAFVALLTTSFSLFPFLCGCSSAEDLSSDPLFLSFLSRSSDSFASLSSMSALRVNALYQCFLPWLELLPFSPIDPLL